MMIDYDALRAAGVRIIGDAIAKPRLMRLGNPTLSTADKINVPLTETDRPGMVYIHDPVDQNSVGMALNSGMLPRAELIYGNYVLVKTDEQGLDIIAALAPRERGEYMYGVPARDPVTVLINQLDYGLLQPTAPLASMDCVVSAAIWSEGGALYYVAAQLTARNFTADIPGTTGLAKAILVEITPSTGVLTYTAGSTFDATLTHEQAFNAYYPQPSGGAKRPVGYVRVAYGMTAIQSPANIFPAQFALGASAGGDDTLPVYMALWW